MSKKYTETNTVGGERLSEKEVPSSKMKYHTAGEGKIVDISIGEILPDSSEKSIRVGRMIEQLVDNKENSAFFMDHPEDYLRIFSLTKNDVNIDSLKRIVIDMIGSNSNVIFPPGQNVQTYKSYTQTGMYTKFNSDSFVVSKSSQATNSNTKFNGLDVGINEIRKRFRETEKLKKIGEWIDVQIDSAPLITQEVMDAISIASRLFNLQDADQISIDLHHIENIGITKLIGDMVMDEELEQSLRNGITTILSQYKLLSEDINIEAAVELSSSIRQKLGSLDGILSDRDPVSGIPHWFFESQILSLITRKDINRISR